MAEVDRVKRNIKKLIKAGATEQEIDSYVRSEGVSISELKTGMSAGAALASSVGGGFNRGLAKVAGLPVDLMTGALNLIPGIDIQQPVGGSESLQRGLAALRMAPQPGQQLPNEFAGRISEEIGAATVPFGIIGGLARIAKTGGKFGEPILNMFRQQPAINAAAELFSAGGAGLGAALAQELAPGNQQAEVWGQLAGGLLSPGSGLSMIRPAKTGIGKALSPLMPGGAERSAARQLHGIVDDPQAAARALSRPQQSYLTPAQEIGDEGMLQLQEAMMRASPQVDEQVARMRTATQRDIRGQADEMSGSIRGATRDFLKGRVDDISTALDDRVSRAMDRAARRVAELDTGASPEKINLIAREEIEGAYDAAKAVERSAWEKVPKDVPVNTTEIKSRFSNLIRSLPKAQQGDMPDVARQLMSDGGLEDIDALGEVQGLRSKLLEIARNARAGDTPSFNTARIADELADAALESMSKSQGGDALENALTISRQNAEKFRQGQIGRILGSQRTGAQRISPESTLEAVYKEGPEGAARLDAMLKASPELERPVADFMRQRFIMQATDPQTGRVTPQSAARFMARNKPVLDRLPEVRNQLTRAKQAQDIAVNVERTSALRKKNIMDKRKSRAALYLDSPVGQEVRKVLQSKDPVKNIRQLAMQASKDKSGAALKGLKGEFLDEMMTPRRSGEISGDDLQRFFTTNRKTIESLFSPDEIGRIKKIVDTAKRLDSAAKTGRSIDQILEESPDAIVDLIARITGANLGSSSVIANTSGAQLVMAGHLSRMMRNITNKIPVSRTRDILSEAVINRDVMRDLLTRVTPTTQEPLQRRMNAWLVNLAPGEDIEQGEEQ